MIFVFVINLIFIGLFSVAMSSNLFKKLMGIVIFQSGVLLLYISGGYVFNGSPPILPSLTIAVNPVPQVLMLTAIVVGISTLAVGVAILLKVKEKYFTVNNDKILSKINEEKDE